MNRALIVTLLILSCQSFVACSGSAETRPIKVRVDAGKIIRLLPDRSMFGQNLVFAGHANHTWDPHRQQFRQPFWKRFKEINPGILRFPGGNWCYGYHFNLAREGIPHRVNNRIVTPSFRPQDFLKTLHELPDVRALIHLSPIWSSPEEIAAFIAYMIGEPNDDRSIGLDSWGRVDPRTKRKLDWKNIGYWARLRKTDSQKPYQGMLYFQAGNEDWFEWCRDGSCNGMKDFYGRVRPARQMTVEDTGLKDPESKVRVEAYWPNYRAIYRKIRQLFDNTQVKIGALIYARPDGAGGADKFFRTAGRRGKQWNSVLLGRLNKDSQVSADFVTVHTYHYDRHGWEKSFRKEGSSNLLFASDHLAARIDKIFEYAKSPHYPVMITEFNTNLSDNIPPSSLLSALFYIDFSITGLKNSDIVGMMRWQTASWRQRRIFKGGSLFATDASTGSKNDIWKMSSYYAAKLLGNLHRKILDTTVVNPPTFKPYGFNAAWKSAGEKMPWWIPSDLPLLSAVATLSDDGTELAIVLLNKNTDRDLNIHLALNGFRAKTSYTRTILNTLNPNGFDDIFKINPWRITRKSKCKPPNGGCSISLEPESGENIALTHSVHNGAGKEFPITVPAHSAVLIVLIKQQA